MIKHGCLLAGHSVVLCPAGKKVIGGGCESTDIEEEIEASHPGSYGTYDGTGWYCRFDTCNDEPLSFHFTTVAICANVQ